MQPSQPNAGANAPLILTLALEGAAQERLDRLRRAHFPSERNFIPAHLTLFHHLPAEHERAVVADVEDACARRGPLTLTATAPLLLGRGVAYRFDAPGLAEVRARLAELWWPWLGAQDRQPFRPHVTVQNKVAPERARALYARLREEFRPVRGRGRGPVPVALPRRAVGPRRDVPVPRVTPGWDQGIKE